MTQVSPEELHGAAQKLWRWMVDNIEPELRKCFKVEVSFPGNPGGHGLTIEETPAGFSPLGEPIYPPTFRGEHWSWTEIVPE